MLDAKQIVRLIPFALGGAPARLREFSSRNSAFRRREQKPRFCFQGNSTCTQLSVPSVMAHGWPVAASNVSSPDALSRMITSIATRSRCSDGTAYANSRAASMTGVPGAVPLAAPSFSVSPGPSLLMLHPFGAVPHATSYAAQLCDSAGAHCQSAISVTTAGHTFIGLTAGTTYTITLTAVGDGAVYVNSPAASRSGTAWWACLMVDATTNGPAANTLQAAVDTAHPGDMLTVYGTCHGNATINENLNVGGQTDPAFGAPTLDGDKTGSVVTIGSTSGPTVNITGLSITDSWGANGGGIDLLAGALTLNRSVVSDSEDVPFAVELRDGDPGLMFKQARA